LEIEHICGERIISHKSDSILYYCRFTLVKQDLHTGLNCPIAAIKFQHIKGVFYIDKYSVWYFLGIILAVEASILFLVFSTDAHIFLNVNNTYFQNN
jgi:hypothetical protein